MLSISQPQAPAGPAEPNRQVQVREHTGDRGVCLVGWRLLTSGHVHWAESLSPAVTRWDAWGLCPGRGPSWGGGVITPAASMAVPAQHGSGGWVTETEDEAWFPAPHILRGGFTPALGTVGR